VSVIKSEHRLQRFVRARFAICYLAHDILGYSYPEIGRQICRDHTTTIYAAARARELIHTDSSFAELVAELSELIRPQDQTRTACTEAAE
jgi:chromosomal replication initiation ATPase DnaA